MKNRFLSLTLVLCLVAACLAGCKSNVIMVDETKQSIEISETEVELTAKYFAENIFINGNRIALDCNIDELKQEFKSSLGKKYKMELDNSGVLKNDYKNGYYYWDYSIKSKDEFIGGIGTACKNNDELNADAFVVTLFFVQKSTHIKLGAFDENSSRNEINNLLGVPTDIYDRSDKYDLGNDSYIFFNYDDDKTTLYYISMRI